jgi:hypothetical protein
METSSNPTIATGADDVRLRMRRAGEMPVSIGKLPIWIVVLLLSSATMAVGSVLS